MTTRNYDIWIRDEIEYLKNSGRMSRDLIYVEDNVHDIPRRIRQEVNPDFIVMFNPRTQKYEIHRLCRYMHTLELTLPFDGLDSQAIEYALYSRDVKRVRQDLEEHNARLAKAQREAIEDERRIKTKELFTYCMRNSDKETWDEGAYTTRWV